jgi:uncharacterized protein involved in type VI secretion and phage assembly
MPLNTDELEGDVTESSRDADASLPTAEKSELAERTRRIPGPTPPFYGVYPALVSDIVDPDGQGRVKVLLPWAIDPERSSFEAWARVATLMAGNNRGSWFIPDVGDEVLVAFEAGHPQRPYVVGALWNGKDQPPETMDGAGENNVKIIKSRNGVEIRMEDEGGNEKVALTTPGGQTVTLQDGPGQVTITDSNGNEIELSNTGIKVNASAKVEVNASTVDISAGLISVNAGMSNFSGVVKCDTLIANSVVGASYTPGAGNIW